jgi:hypothetical protein
MLLEINSEWPYRIHQVAFMSCINLSLSPQQKLDIAKQYAAKLCGNHKSIETIIVSGSIVRGTSIPPSDVDLWCILSDRVLLSDIHKGFYQGIYVDIEQFPADGLTIEQILSDSYIFGYLTGAMILYDRNGSFETLMQKICKLKHNETYRRVRLRKLLDPIRRNLLEFRQSLQNNDEREVCRSSSFSLWCLGDYLLTMDGKPPGGFRILSRLQTHLPDAYFDIIDLQGSSEMDVGQVGRLVEAYIQCVQPEVSWRDKQYWMLDHGLKDEVFQSLTINLGLTVKNSTADVTSVKAICKQLLTEIGWSWGNMKEVVTRYENHISKYLVE